MPQTRSHYMPRWLWVLAVVLAFLAASVTRPLAGDTPPPDPAQLIAQADALFAKREDPAAAQKAVKLYKQVLEIKPDSEKASVRLAWLLVYMGSLLDDKDQQAEYYQEAIKAAELGVEHHPKSPGPRYWLGVAYGLTADCSGPFAGICLVPPMKDELEALLEMDPKYGYGGAYRVLGRLYTKLPGLLGGDLDKAEEYLRKAVELGPKFWLNHLYLAAVLGEKGRCEDAIKLVKMAAKGEPVPGMEPESKLWKKYANRVLAALQNGEDSKLVLAKCN